MELGMIGLGRMGSKMVRRLLDGGHRVVVYDTVKEAVELAVPVPVITESLQVRFRSRQEQPFGTRLLAVLRKQFGGHAVREIKR